MHRECTECVKSVGSRHVEIVDQWNGRRATALQKALRLTNEAFANQLGTAIRTVAKWNAEPELVQVPEMQRALDTLLSRSPEDVKARLAILLATERQTSTLSTPAAFSAPLPRIPEDVETRLNRDRQVGMVLEWLDTSADWPVGTSQEKVRQQLTRIDYCEVQNRGHRRGRIGQRAIAKALAGYYADGFGEYGLYQAHNGIGSMATSIMTRMDWLDIAVPLGTGHDDFDYAQPTTSPTMPIGEVARDAAIGRVVDALATHTMLTNTPLYRMLSVGIRHGYMSGTLSLTNFFGYALTLDLLENELLDALASGSPTSCGHLPLRDHYLPSVAAVLDLQHRVCVGGPLALFAVARPHGRSQRSASDYLFLIQERSGRVLNSAQRLAVIPKSFHEPLVDFHDDTPITASLEREMEEELFGRVDVDSAQADLRSADPMHPSKLSPPMKWLANHTDGGHWRMECTGFGFNLVAGNYECASLIVIEDDGWWGEFGGHIGANWESDRLRRYSSLDYESAKTLAYDPSWSNEGLFALLQGFRRLTEIGGARVNLPSIEWELAHG